METQPPQPLLLQRIDPNQNMARYYCVAVEPTLFGWGSVVRTWGRIGTLGRTKIELFDTMADSEAAAALLARVKRRRGYAEPRWRERGARCASDRDRMAETSKPAW